jgi:hypothetical protein
MINFRYHLVSLAAVLVALGVGLVMGAGLLSSGTGSAAATEVVDLQAQAALLREQVADAEATLSFSEAYGQAVQPGQVDGALADTDVVVVALPGADDTVVSATREAVTQSGARVVGTVAVQPAWTDAASQAVLDALAAQLVTSGVSLDEGADGYQRGAVVLASALLEPTGGSEAEPEVLDTVPAAFADAGVVAVDGSLRGTADLAVLVAGDPVADDGEAGRRLGALTSLAAAFDAAGSGAVVAGPPQSASALGVVGAVRADVDAAAQVSTVDMAHTSSGRTAAVLALAEQASGGAGHYGGVGEVDGALPPRD